MWLIPYLLYAGAVSLDELTHSQLTCLCSGTKHRFSKSNMFWKFIGNFSKIKSVFSLAGSSVFWTQPTPRRTVHWFRYILHLLYGKLCEVGSQFPLPGQRARLFSELCHHRAEQRIVAPRHNVVFLKLKYVKNKEKIPKNPSLKLNYKT